MRIQIETIGAKPQDYTYIAVTGIDFAHAMSNFQEQILFQKKLKFPLTLRVSLV